MTWTLVGGVCLPCQTRSLVIIQIRIACLSFSLTEARLWILKSWSYLYLERLRKLVNCQSLMYYKKKTYSFMVWLSIFLITSILLTGASTKKRRYFKFWTLSLLTTFPVVSTTCIVGLIMKVLTWKRRTTIIIIILYINNYIFIRRDNTSFFFTQYLNHSQVGRVYEYIFIFQS